MSMNWQEIYATGNVVLPTTMLLLSPEPYEGKMLLNPKYISLLYTVSNVLEGRPVIFHSLIEQFHCLFVH